MNTKGLGSISKIYLELGSSKNKVYIREIHGPLRTDTSRLEPDASGLSIWKISHDGSRETTTQLFNTNIIPGTDSNAVI